MAPGTSGRENWIFLDAGVCIKGFSVQFIFNKGIIFLFENILVSLLLGEISIKTGNLI